ncbi:MAG: hypothetical protein ACRD3L_14535 [Terriglobales bacterium]
MKYVKPEIVALGPAVAAIQSILSKGPYSHRDNSVMPATFNDPPAYEADE